MSAPITPNPPHATLPDGQHPPSQTSQSSNMTPPPSTQVSSTSARTKSRTPTPTYSHISTPPPTIETSGQAISGRPTSAYARDMTTEQINTASTDELRAKVAEFQAAYQEAKMTAAHHRLQYRMLAQESAAAIERMAVEARMAQYENEVIHIASAAKAAVMPIQHPSALQTEGTIPVQKDLYQRMCREIQHLTESNHYLETSHRQQEKVIQRQENEIASLGDKVTLLRDRIRENRDHQSRFRSASLGRQQNIDSTPRSVYNTPRRAPPSSAQPFAALLQASEMASSREASGKASTNPKTGHKRNIHSLSSMPTTPSRAQRQPPPLFQTPQPRRSQAAAAQVPATAPVPRMIALSRGSPEGVYAQHSLPVPGPMSDGTVSASEHEGPDHDGGADLDNSEAETEILDPDQHEVVGESSASRAASQMLRSSREAEASRSFQGRGMLEGSGSGSGRGGGLRQGKLFGAVKKTGVFRAGDEEPSAKRARTATSTGEGIGLGIAGVRQ